MAFCPLEAMRGDNIQDARCFSVAQPIEILRCPKITLWSCRSSEHRRKVPPLIKPPADSQQIGFPPRFCSYSILTSYKPPPLASGFLLPLLSFPFDDISSAPRMPISLTLASHTEAIAQPLEPLAGDPSARYTPGIQCSGLQPNYRTSPLQAAAIKSNYHGSI